MEARRVECDPRKDVINRRKHRLSLYYAQDVDWEGAVSGISGRDRYGRLRRFAIGMYRDRLHIVIFSDLGAEARSVISFRRADAKERKAYHDRD
jgi:uncharacterized DUF497 family protein